MRLIESIGSSKPPEKISKKSKNVRVICLKSSQDKSYLSKQRKRTSNVYDGKGLKSLTVTTKAIIRLHACFNCKQGRKKKRRDPRYSSMSV